MPDPYVARADVDAVIPPHIVLKALDDDQDDAEDTGLWDKIADAVETMVDGYLAPRYSLPLDSVPQLVKSCSLTLTCEMLYDRCGFSGDQNPWTARANAVRNLLDRVAQGQIGLGTDFDPAGDTGSVSEPSKTYNNGKLIV